MKTNTNKLLTQFKEKTFYAEETVVLTLFGAYKLEDFELLPLSRPEHYLLITAEELNSATLQNRVTDFALDIKNNYAKYSAELCFTLAKNLQANLGVDKAALLQRYLSFMLEAQDAQHLLKTFAINDQQFYEALNLKIVDTYADKVVAEFYEKNFISKLKKIIPPKQHLAENEKKLGFIEQSALRLIDNKLTLNIFASVLSRQNLKIIIASDYKKFLALTGQQHSDTHPGGATRPQLDLIVLYWGGLYNQFPNLSILGGIGFNNAKFKERLLESGRDLDVTAPFTRIIAEECFDYWLSLQTSREALSAVLNEYATILPELDKIIVEHNQIIELKLAKHSLNKQQEKTWAKMVAEATKIYQSANPTPGRLFLETQPEMPIGYRFSFMQHGVNMPIEFKKFLGPKEPPYWTEDVHNSQRLGLWETPIIEGKLTEEQVVGLYKWLATEYTSIRKIITAKYKNYNALEEFLGKLYAYYVFAPGYIESFLPKLHQLYTKLYKNSADINQLDINQYHCTNEVCVRLSIGAPIPLLSSFNENLFTNRLAASTENLGNTDAHSENELTTPDVLPTIMLGLVLTRMCKNTFAGIANLLRFAQHDNQTSKLLSSTKSEITKNQLIAIQNNCRKYIHSYPQAHKWFHYFLEDLDKDIEEIIAKNTFTLETANHCQVKLENFIKSFNINAKQENNFNNLSAKTSVDKIVPIATLTQTNPCRLFSIAPARSPFLLAEELRQSFCRTHN